MDSDETKLIMRNESSPKKEVGFSRILELAKYEKGRLIFAIIALFISSFSNLALAKCAGSFVDLVTSNQDPSESKRKINSRLILLIAIVFVGSVSNGFKTYLLNCASERLVARLRNLLFHKIVNQDIPFFDLNRTGELLNRLSEDTQIIKNAATSNLADALKGMATGILGVAYMFYISYKLTFLSLLVLPFVASGIRFFGMHIKTLSEKTQTASAMASAVAEEALGSIRTVKSFAKEEFECDKYEKMIENTMSLGINQAVAMGILSGSMFGSISLCVCIIVSYGSHLTVDSKITLSNLTTFILFSVAVGLSFGNLSGLYSTMMKAIGASKRVFLLIDLQPSLPTAGDIIPTLNNNRGGEICFHDVWFAYPSRIQNWVLKGVDLNIKSGECVALVGPSGGGKTTIVNLIERFYDPQLGYITIDGIQLPQMQKNYLHKIVSIVSQEPSLFHCTVAQNIAYASSSFVDMESIKQAAYVANAHDFISLFPEGYDTLVGERGVRLSGGQKQRIAIARAVLMNPRVLLLDEATSALDAESEYLVQDAMQKLMSGRTTVVIAHRLSTVQNADMVLVIDKGAVAEMGRHLDLLSQNGIYARLVRRQLHASEPQLQPCF